MLRGGEWENACGPELMMSWRIDGYTGWVFDSLVVGLGIQLLGLWVYWWLWDHGLSRNFKYVLCPLFVHLCVDVSACLGLFEYPFSCI